MNAGSEESPPAYSAAQSIGLNRMANIGAVETKSILTFF